MFTAYKYRIYPKPEQEVRLKRSLVLLMELYNKLRTKKIEEHKQNEISLTLTNLRTFALEERRFTEELRSVYSQTVQNMADRVHMAFENFFEGRARFPKPKSPNKYLSMTYPHAGFKFNPQHGLDLFRIGHVRAFIHRPPLGKIKRLTIKREADKWYAIFITERITPPKLPIQTVSQDRIRGADFGLEKFVVLDNSDSVESPRFTKQSETRIAALQRRLAHKHRGSRRWKETCLSLAKLYLHIGRRREDFQNKLISKIFKENDVLILEKLPISGMLRNHSIAKSISDAAWGKFAKKSISKAEVLGKHVITIDPWGTTQFCYNCLDWVPKDLSMRQHICPNCGINVSHDLNSGRLIKRLGIQSCPPSDGGVVTRRAETSAVPPWAGKPRR